ncbi:MAG: phosphatase PAP2 family protein [Nocardioides sp.]
MPRSSPALRIAAVTGALYLLLTALVAVHVLDPLDQAVRRWLRPDAVWGPVQIRAAHVAEGLKPLHVIPLLVVVALLCAVVQRSWRPVVVGGVAAVGTAGLVVVTKILVARPDPGDQITSIGGAYPSGHAAVLVAVTGAGLLAIIARPAWWSWTYPVLGNAVMGYCLAVQSVHWFTDVVGGMLLAFSVLAVSSWLSSQWERREAHRRPSVAASVTSVS